MTSLKSLSCMSSRSLRLLHHGRHTQLNVGGVHVSVRSAHSAAAAAALSPSTSSRSSPRAVLQSSPSHFDVNKTVLGLRHSTRADRASSLRNATNLFRWAVANDRKDFDRIFWEFYNAEFSQFLFGRSDHFSDGEMQSLFKSMIRHCNEKRFYFQAESAFFACLKQAPHLVDAEMHCLLMDTFVRQEKPLEIHRILKHLTSRLDVLDDLMFYPFLLALARTHDIDAIVRLSRTLAKSERPLALSDFHWAAIVKALSDTHERRVQAYLHKRHSLSSSTDLTTDQIREDLAAASRFRAFSDKFRSFLDEMAPLTARNSFSNELRSLHSMCVSGIEKIGGYIALDVKGVDENVAACKFISSYEPRAADVTDPLSEEKIERYLSILKELCRRDKEQFRPDHAERYRELLRVACVTRSPKYSEVFDALAKDLHFPQMCGYAHMYSMVIRCAYEIGDDESVKQHFRSLLWKVRGGDLPEVPQEISDIVALSCARHDPSFAAEVLEEIADNEQQTSEKEVHVDIPRILATDTWTNTFEALAKAGEATDKRRVLDLLRALHLHKSRAYSFFESSANNSFHSTTAVS